MYIKTRSKFLYLLIHKISKLYFCSINMKTDKKLNLFNFLMYLYLSLKDLIINLFILINLFAKYIKFINLSYYK